MFKYSPVVWALLSLVIILSAAGLIWNIYSLVEYSLLGGAKTVTHALMIIITAALILFVISVMVYGRYVVTEKYLIQYFGLVKNKTELSKIIAITHFKKSDKLVAYFSDQKYTVIVISPALYDAFVLSVRDKNPSVVFDSRIDGEDTPE
ncbi:MAG: hypothetical protein IKB30_03605 [Clostridia bacterium]|nr:hypothetical protein [Clostridia bacterium]